MLVLTRLQREAVHRIWNRTERKISYRTFRRLVQPGPGCAMVPYCGMILGVEPDGYTHS
jgi:hypothetical protein